MEMEDNDREFLPPSSLNEEPETAAPVAVRVAGPVAGPEDVPQDVLDFCAGEYGNGQQLSITRLAPHWCAGYLDTLPLDAPVSLAEIRDNWGGKRFQLRVLDSHGRYVKAYNVRIDGPPKRNGRLVTPEMEYEFKQGNPAAIQHFTPTPIPDGPNPTKELLEFFKAQTAAQQALINDLFLRAVTPAASGGPAGGLGAIGEARDLIAFARELNVGEGAPADDTSNKLLEKVLDAFVSAKAKAAAPNPAPPAQLPPFRGPQPAPRLNVQPPPDLGPRRSVAPPLVAPAPGAPPPVTIEAAADPAPVQADTGPETMTPAQLAAVLSSMGPEAAAGVVATVLDSWPPDKQKAAMDALLGPEEDEEPEGVDNGAAPVTNLPHVSGGG